MSHFTAPRERQHYVNGAWVDPIEPKLIDVINPSTEEAFIQIAVGGAADVDRAVAAARTAFPSFSRASRKERIDLLKAILSEYNKRKADIAATLTEEMGALRGWDGPSLPPFRRERGSIPADLLDTLPDAEIEAVGWKASALMQPNASAEGNSAAPSPSPEIPAPTTEG